MSFASTIAECATQPASKYIIVIDNQNDGMTA
jgi:hypothetical protein